MSFDDCASNRHRVRKAAILVFCLTLAGAHGSASLAFQTASSELAECALDLSIPRYGPGGAPGSIDGPILSEVMIGDGGHIASIGLRGGSVETKRIVRAWLGASVFAAKCSGQTVLLQFTFKVEGPESECPFSWVTFRGPNHFVVHSQPRKTHILRMPKEPQKK